MSLIHEKMIEIMKEVDHIGKDKNSKSYKFRGIDDAYNHCHPIFAKHGVFSVSTILKMTREERKSSSGSTLLFSIVELKYSFFAVDGSFIDTNVIGEAFDVSDKSMGKAFSYAHKIALLQMLMIPTEEPKDIELDDHRPEPKQPTAPTEKPIELPHGDYNKAVGYLNTLAHISDIDNFIKQLELKSWAVGEKEKLLLQAENKKVAINKPLEDAEAKLKETFGESNGN